MKVRLGFVSNSSSSSFTCVVCGENVSGMDMGLSDAEMTECTNGHVFCDSHKVKIEAVATEDEDYGDSMDEDEEDSRYEANPKCCPICQLVALDESEGFVYLLKRAGLSKEQLLVEIKTKFANWDEYSDYWSKK